MCIKYYSFLNYCIWSWNVCSICTLCLLLLEVLLRTTPLNRQIPWSSMKLPYTMWLIMCFPPHQCNSTTEEIMWSNLPVLTVCLLGTGRSPLLWPKSCTYFYVLMGVKTANNKHFPLGKEIYMSTIINVLTRVRVRKILNNKCAFVGVFLNLHNNLSTASLLSNLVLSIYLICGEKWWFQWKVIK